MTQTNGAPRLIDTIDKRLQDYFAWLRENTATRQIAGGREYVEITTPHLNRHNDCLQVYARADGDHGYLLTDDGETIGDLESSGCKLDSPKRQALLTMTLNGFGVQVKDRALQVHATEQTFPRKKHDLLQAMLAVDDMFALASPTVLSLFIEDAAAWLEQNNIRAVQNIKLSGRTGYDHTFDFVIAGFRDAPERIVQTINRPGKDTAEALIMKWIDTRDSREDKSQAYALLNDQEQSVPGQVFDALKSYNIEPVAWSEREAVVKKLAA